MTTRSTRRSFLRSAATGGSFLAVADLARLSRLRPASAAEAESSPRVVRLPPKIEPLVQLLEETPRERLLEEVGSRIRHGLGYRDVLAALLLAGVRNVQPRPSVGYKFHAVLVVNSVHLASQAASEQDRWLPVFWALDYFKDSQARDVREGNWTMAPVNETAIPAPSEARESFIEAMDNWDEAAADAAVAGLARSAKAEDVYELFYRYGARDYRSIGHKAIFVASSRRTLEYIGWQYAEPVLRSLAYALLMHEDGNPAERDGKPDRSWRRNQELATEIRDDWSDGKPKPEATRELLEVLRAGSGEDASKTVVRMLNQEISPQSIWDAVFAGAGELLLRQPGIVALHSATTTNAVYYAYRTSRDDLTRRLLLLQNAAFLPQFRESMRQRGRVRDEVIDGLAPLEPQRTGAEAVEEILADVSRDRMTAARKTLGYLQSGGEAEPLIAAARRVLILHGDGAHDYKFGSAVLEDYAHVSPAMRHHFLAASMMQLCGSGDPESGLVKRTRSALQG